ncbi:uncharacterized protein [Nicotiana tomentosiformis]|uniref:uncharacterized protein n=1 Tax=Nicotiana tomentosiformis TaxID=4098 RepID=UPI00388C6BBF
MSFLGRLNYISHFIAQSTVICEPIFKLFKKDAATKWTEECQKAFDRIKEYLSNPPVLVPPEPGKPLLLYLSVLDNAFGCMLGQHDETGRNEQVIYYLSKKFTSSEAKYTLIERTCCALTWIAQKLRHYMLAYTTHLISLLDPLKYIFQKPMPTGKLAKWKILLSEFDIVYITQKAIKGQTLADHLAKNLVDGDYKPLCWGGYCKIIPWMENVFRWSNKFQRSRNWGIPNFGIRTALPSINKYKAETSTYKAVTKKVVMDFVRNIIVCRFGIPESIIVDNAANTNNDLMREICENFRIIHRNFTAYGPQMKGVVEAANKNIKRILRKIVDNHRQWHEKLPFDLLGYRTTMRTSIGETPYMLVYGTEAVIPARVEIPSLRVIQEAKLDDVEWIQIRQ